MSTHRRFMVGSIALLALIASLAILASGAAGGAQSKTAGGTITVGTTEELAPFTYVTKSGSPTGFDLDLVRAAATKLHLKVKFVKTPFAQIYAALAAGKFDMVASAAFIRCEHISGAGKVGEYTVPVYTASTAIAWRTADKATPTLQSLKGKRAGAETVGTAAADILEKNKAKLGLKVSIFNNVNDLLLGLQQKRIDAALESRLVMQYAVRNNRAITVGPSLPGTSVPSGFVFRTGDPRLKDFNKAINALKLNGTTSKIYKKWFGVPPASSDVVVKRVPSVTTKTCTNGG